MARQSFREVSQFVEAEDFSNSAYRSFETWFIFYKMDCQSHAKPSEKDHDLPGIRTLHHLGRLNLCTKSLIIRKKILSVDVKKKKKRHELNRAEENMSWVKVIRIENNNRWEVRDENDKELKNSMKKRMVSKKKYI
jgi:hypothetical protein